MPMNTVYYQNNETIIQSGSMDQKMYVILDGHVRITLTDAENTFTIANLGKGDFFGEISLFNNTPRNATVTALGNVKLFYVEDVDQLKAFLMKNPAFAAKMVQILAQRLARTDEILMGKISELNRIKVTNEI